MKVIDSNGVVYLWGKMQDYVSNANVASASTASKADSVDSVQWSIVKSTPTTVDGYGITDTYTKDDVDTSLATKANIASPTFTGSVTAPKFVTSTGLEIY